MYQINHLKAVSNAMPVNSFENYPMSWKPDKSKLTPPIYLSLANLMEKDIKDGMLLPNTKLPPQRELADFLDLNLSTITKAYKLGEVRGLIHAIVGKGTFVSPYTQAVTSIVEKNSNPIIEMSTLHPHYVHNSLIKDLTIEILSQPKGERLFEYSHPLGSNEQIEIAAVWLRRFHLNASTSTTLIANGVQNALAITLSSLFEYGDKIAVDSYTYPNFIGLANLLHLQLIAIPSDEHGMLPEVLDKLCSKQKIKGLYLMPTASNPTNVTMPQERRKEMASIGVKRDLIIIEDDNLSTLSSTPILPIAHFAADNTIFISGLSKPICSGIRIAYLCIPLKYMPTMEQGAFHQNLKISSLNIEIATEIIRRGLDIQISEEKRVLSVKRNQVYQSFFPNAFVQNESYYQWLYLPKGYSGRFCELKLREMGVGVFGAERFGVGQNIKDDAIRIATCSPTTENELITGLNIIKNFITSSPPHTNEQSNISNKTLSSAKNFIK